jgi:hypothetical protein
MESGYDYSDIALPETEVYTHMTTARDVFAALDAE